MTGKIRLLVTASEFVRGSQARRTYDLISKLDRELFEISIGVMAFGDESAPEVKKLNVPCFQLRLQPSRSLDLHKTASFLSGPFKLIGKRFDIVHSLLYQSYFTEPLLVKTLLGAKYIYVKSNLEWQNHPLSWRLRTKLADKVICQSRAGMNLLAEQGFAARSTLIFNSVDTAHFTASEEKRDALRRRLKLSSEAFVFGCAAQFIPSKDHPTLIRAFGRIAARHPDVALLLCGEDHGDDYHSSVLEEIDALGEARKRLFLLGAVSDMPGFYSAIDCMALPTNKENFGNVFTEAMSCGRAVISGRTGGPLDIIAHGETGYLVDLGSVDDLEAKMESYAANPVLALEHGARGRLDVEARFSLERYAAEIQGLYLSVLGRKPL